MQSRKKINPLIPRINRAMLRKHNITVAEWGKNNQLSQQLISYTLNKCLDDSYFPRGERTLKIIKELKKLTGIQLIN